ncbi:MAG: geranylgeranyl reductase family protein [Burkholderiaceae bacterium]|nr:geranylgeranyl reductase family protein [Microbacteriaceae bacterium]
MHSTGTENWDIVVVGAGPAGAAAAIAARRADAGCRVLLVDRAPIGRDKVCGDGIAPHAVAELELLGVDAVRPDEMVPVVRLTAPGGLSASAETRAPGYVVPRARFDARLVRAAIDAGAEFRQHRVASVEQDGTTVTLDGTLRARTVIAADGSNSVLRRRVGEPANRGRALAVAVRGYAPTPDGVSRELVIRWDRQRSGGLCYAWAFPVADGTTNVGYGLSSAAEPHDRAHLVARLAALLPEYALDGVRLTGHTLPLTIYRPRPAVGRVLLTGDAASLINPVTGEGIYSAIASGAAAGRAAALHPLTAAARYTAFLAARFGRQHRQLRGLYPLIDLPVVLDTVVRAGARNRRELDRLLEVGLGDSSFSGRDVLRFARAARG